MLNLKDDDYIYAEDEKCVLKIKGKFGDNYSATYVGGSGNRGFDPNASHYRLATEEEIAASYIESKVVIVKPNTEAWEMVYKAYHYHEKWTEHNTEIREFLGFEGNENIYHSVNCLYINPTNLKDEWKDQFKKNTNPAQAKTKAKVNLQWISLCKKLGLEVHNLRDFQLKYGLYFTTFSVFDYDGIFYVEFNKKISINQFHWASAISEPEFLRIKADFLERNPKKET